MNTFQDIRVHLKPEQVDLKTFPFHAIYIFDAIVSESISEILKTRNAEQSFERSMICRNCALDVDRNDSFFRHMGHPGFDPDDDLEKCTSNSSNLLNTHSLTENQMSLRNKKHNFETLEHGEAPLETSVAINNQITTGSSSFVNHFHVQGNLVNVFGVNNGEIKM